MWIICCLLLSLALANDEWLQWDDEVKVGDTAEFEERRRSKLEVESEQREGPVPCSHGYSGRPQNAIGCTDVGGGVEWSGRIITCASGYYAHPNKWSATIFIPWTYGHHTPFQGCLPIDECAAYGWSGAASCQDLFNARRITCPAYTHVTGEAVNVQSVTLTGGARFGGCTAINYCVQLRMAQEPFVKSCSPSGPNRIVTCQDGYYAIAPTNPTVTLGPDAKFAGCKMIDYCALYGFSGTGAEKIGATCTQAAIKQRTLTCPSGYALAGTNKNPPSRVVTLFGDAKFVGCAQVDFCKLLGYSGRTEFTKSCTPSLNARTIVCDDTHFPIGAQGSHSITLVGETPFGGCVEANLCTIHGFSGHSEGVLSCAAGVGKRTVTCQPGYGAIGSDMPNGPSVVLQGSAVFMGCKLIDNCNLYGYSNKPANTRACVNGKNQRTILCEKGFFAGPNNTDSVVLMGSEEFQGCHMTDNCIAYGFSGLKENTSGCKNGLNQRTITCAVGYYPKNNDMSRRDVTLIGPSPFEGCTALDECELYGFNDLESDTASCKDLQNAREITCNQGFYATAPDVRRVTLTGNAPFRGCTRILTCELYGSSGKPDFVESCKQTATNSRTVTCLEGYGVIGQGESFQVTLTGNAPFPGCKLIPMCEIYGVSKRPENVARCVPGVNTRTIFCNPGYHVLQYEHDHTVKSFAMPFPTQVKIDGYDAFYGCKAVCGNGIVTPGEACDDGNLFSDDGCNNCVVEGGYVCGPPSEGCCFAGTNYEMLVNQMKLVCRGGYWVSPAIDDGNPQIGFPTTPGKRRGEQENSADIILNDGELKLCGSVDLKSKLSILGTGHLHIAGYVTVHEGGHLELSTDTEQPRIVVTAPCPAWVGGDQIKFDVKRGGLVHVVQDSPMPLNEDADSVDENDLPLIKINGCFHFNGNFKFDAHSIPQEDNYYPLISKSDFQDCTSYVDPEYIEHTLPSCPGVELESHKTYNLIHTYTVPLCTPSIIGVSVAGAAAVTILVGAVVAFLYSPAQPSYVPL